jgi:two-component system cell cycle sensor histidine kinase/response regulator CckA
MRACEEMNLKSMTPTIAVNNKLWMHAKGIGFLLIPVPFLVIMAMFMATPKTGLWMVLTAAILMCLAAYLWVLQQRAQTQQRLLVDAIPRLLSIDVNPAFLADEVGEIISANDVADERFGTTSENTLAKRFGALIANPEAIIFRLQSRADTAYSAREDIVTRTGQYRLSVARIGQDAYLWRFDDLVSGDKSARQSHEMMSLPMLTAGQSGAILYLNEAFHRLLGRRPLALHDIFGVDDIQNGDIYRIKTENGPVDCIAAEIFGPAGRREIYVIETMPNGRGPRPLGGDWDAIEDLPVPLLKISGDGDVLASNREARALLGLQTTEGKRVADMLDGLGRPVGDWIHEAVEGHGGNVSQFLRGRGDFEDTFVQVTLNLAGGDKDPHLVAVLNDVTELKTLEAQFVQSQKMQAIGQLAGGVAHDFNNLLTAISGHCDLLLLRHDHGDQDYGDLIQIHQNANRAASLVGQLLAFSRKQNLQPEIVDMRDALSDLTHLLNRLVGEKVSLSVRHDPELTTIKADKRQLEQVMMNLVVNARDAMPDGGAIRVVTENLTLTKPMERDRAFVPPGDYVVVKVSDEGHGISPEKLPKIFEPFYTTKRQGEGTGLGLSTAYGIVKQTGGDIFAGSESGKGTRILLLFPRFVLPKLNDHEEPEPEPTPLTNNVEGVVLLVEDEAPVRAFASRALRLRGYTVLEADCAEAALSLLEDPDLNVDLFVTDVIMPGKNGPTWVREALIARPDTKVVFVSGYAEEAFSDEQSRVPHSVFLPKPFSLSDLTKTVQNQLQ